MRLRLAELIAALSLATDLGLGLPQEHVLRQCRIALGLAERVGVDEAERAAVYYVAMLAWVGCTADSYELSAQFGDEIAFRADAHPHGPCGPAADGVDAAAIGDGQGPLRRAQLAATLVATGGRAATEAMTAHCRVAAAIAARLGLGPEVQQPLLHVFSRWDGKGMPKGCGGEELPARDPACPHRDDRRGAPPHRRRRGRDRGRPRPLRWAVRPAAGGGFADARHDLLDALDGGVQLGRRDRGRAGPGHAAGRGRDRRRARGRRRLLRPQVALVRRSLRGVATLAAGAAERAGLPARRRHAAAAGGARARPRALRRAEHDLGQAGRAERAPSASGCGCIPTTPSACSPGPESLAALGAIAVCHHERLGRLRLPPLAPGLGALARRADPGGGGRLPRDDRSAPAPGGAPARRALPPSCARKRGRGAFDADAAEDVLAAAGHARAGARERARPGGLTAREFEVLLLVARGASSRDVARRW